MIGKGQSISHTNASMRYGWNQEKEAEVIFKEHLYGNTPNEITQEFKLLQDQNHNCTKNTLSFVISPTIEDGKDLNSKELNKITKEFIKQLNLQDRQAIAFVHKDKEHKHIHLYVNRIDYKGQAYNDSFIGKRSQQAAEKVAERLHLTTVKQVQFEKEFQQREIRQEIKRRHDLAIKQFQPKNFDDYIKAMAANKVKVIPSINKQDKLQGFRFEFQGHNLKGSEVDRKMSLANLGREINKNSYNQFIKPKTNTVSLLGTPVELSTKMALKIAKVVIKRAIDNGIGW
ncbi:MAG: relaxase/mobilization nuclease domain-containing protein [Bacteroidetes bacterium]|nr:relaxase/mobilization nuclease domain-containing protein [Bacteroidota bacterium]